ncbi:MAG: type I-U CRISPR-associated protein Cas5/Cas6 [Alicyclobacillus sp.]|nr:type I-U CRISPR-associated protein Cas5/Cas6 [Alicyclobacillus sp.]
MIGIELRFPAGGYHATPWGRHVNEAEVEWPPSPWRLLRSLIAAWYRYAMYEVYPESLLREAIQLLATELPSYALPPAVHAHTRHYMPLGGNKTSLVFDGFLRLPQDAVLGVYWPHLSATPEQRQLLADLGQRLGYLGRAESWVQAEVVDECRMDINCAPVGSGLADDPAQTLEAVYVLAPYTPQQYAEWLLGQTDGHSIRAGEGARGRGRRPAAAGTALPRDLLDALRVDTNDLQAQRRNLPAGARWVVYQRLPLQQTAANALRGSVLRAGSHRPAMVERVNTARLALTSRVLPRWGEVLDVSEVMHLALLYRSSGEAQAPWLVSGREADGRVSERGHEHLFILPEDADGDGRIDHVLLYAAEPFPPALLQALQDLRRLHTPVWWPGPERGWDVYLEGWMYHPDVMKAVMTATANGPTVHTSPPARAESTGGTEMASLWQSKGATPVKLALTSAARAAWSVYLQAGRVWVSRTPYLHPWHVKRNGKFGVEDQIRRELKLRGWPEPVRLTPLPAIEVHGSLWPTQRFRKLRYGKGQRLPDMRGSFWQLEFAETVGGPLCLGANCHFGMGLFVPVTYER